MHLICRKCRFRGKVRMAWVLEPLTGVRSEQVDGRKSHERTQMVISINAEISSSQPRRIRFCSLQTNPISRRATWEAPGRFCCRLLATK